MTAVWITILKVRLRRRKNMHKETLRELLQIRADKRFLMLEQNGNVGRRNVANDRMPAVWAEANEDEATL
jgi:E3 ubiquitin-protein ligase DOA10